MKMSKLTKQEAAYIAGIFDGEGSLFVGKGWTHFVVTQGEKGIALLHFLKRTIGVGTIVLHQSGTEKWQAIYRYRIASPRLIQLILKQIAPYLIVKKERVQRYMDFPS